MQVHEKVGKSRNTLFFQCFVAPEGQKVGLRKRASWPNERLKLARRCGTVVALSTFASQNVQNTAASQHFYKLRCRKSARRCGAKRCGAKDILKSKCTKHLAFAALLDIEMSKKCTLLWREARSEAKSVKTHHSQSTFGSCDVVKVHAVAARSTFGSKKC